jgi:hypothetical protein
MAAWQPRDHWAVVVPVDEASSVKTIEGAFAAWMMTILELVEVKPVLSVVGRLTASTDFLVQDSGEPDVIAPNAAVGIERERHVDAGESGEKAMRR